ncbi:extensin [Streptomyces sp. NPDC059590]|uniref:extensin n=1 Tax=Streptomyces sp. NPDC059590 TaxID=3346877 RepID=UPI0036739F4E
MTQRTAAARTPGVAQPLAQPGHALARRASGGGSRAALPVQRVAAPPRSPAPSRPRPQPPAPRHASPAAPVRPRRAEPAPPVPLPVQRSGATPARTTASPRPPLPFPSTTLPTPAAQPPPARTVQRTPTASQNPRTTSTRTSTHTTKTEAGERTDTRKSAASERTPTAGFDPRALTDGQLDELVHRLIGPLTRLLRTELRLDRERVGRLRDPRR